MIKKDLYFGYVLMNISIRIFVPDMVSFDLSRMKCCQIKPLQFHWSIDLSFDHAAILQNCICMHLVHTVNLLWSQLMKHGGIKHM